MATQAQAEEELVFVPNIRPEGIEYAGDRHWRDWRLRKRRPELRERYNATFPNINPLLDREAKAQIDAQENVKLVQFTKRTLEDLHNDKSYRVERLQFRPLQETHDRVEAIWAATRPRKPRPQEELDKLPAFFFESLSSSLFARVWDFAAETFGQQPAVDGRSDIEKQADFDSRLQNTDWTRRFLQHLPPDFIRCVSEVARGDYNNRGRKAYDPHGYEFLFLNRDQRVHLCTAVIAKLLQEQCFESLLFGALKIERDALSKTDIAQEGIANGFARKMSRTSSVPKYLRSELFTTNFWQEVDRVTIGILDLLLPMINFVGELEPDVRVLPLTEVHQQLHKIVAEAGWIANGLAFTRSCFWIEFPQPGQLWEVRQEHVTDVVWKASKQFADRNDVDDLDNKVMAWQQDRLAAYNALDDHSKPALSAWSKDTYELDNPRPRPIRRTAKVQISMWPFFDRSYPVRQELVSGDFSLGESTTLLQKAQVVYYAGNDADAGEQLEDVTLQQYLEDYRRKRAIFRGSRAWISWPFILILLLLALLSAYPRIRASHAEVRHRDWNISSQVLPDWSWPTWKLPRIDGPRTRRDEQLQISTDNLPGSPSQSSPEASHLITSNDLSISWEDIMSTPSSRYEQQPRIQTSLLYSTTTWTKTELRTRTRYPEDTLSEQGDDRTGSATTIPSGRSKDSQSSKQSYKPSLVKPIIEVGEDSSSTTVVPETVHAPEPTEEPSPVPTQSGLADVLSTTEETLTEHTTSSKPTEFHSSFWERLLHLGGANKAPQKAGGITEVPNEKHTTEVPIEKHTTEVSSEKHTTEVFSEKHNTEVSSEKHTLHNEKGTTTTEGPRSGNTKVVIDEFDFTKTHDHASAESVSTTGKPKGFSSHSDEAVTDDSSKAHETKSSTHNWHSKISSAWNELGSHIKGHDDKPAPSFTTDVPPDVVFTDPAQPGVTLDMEEGFWVQIHPLGFEYNCFIKSRVADCTSTVWTTVTAEPTAETKLTEGPWKPTV